MTVEPACPSSVDLVLRIHAPLVDIRQATPLHYGEAMQAGQPPRVVRIAHPEPVYC